jgi:hypothetical protein
MQRRALTVAMVTMAAVVLLAPAPAFAAGDGLTSSSPSIQFGDIPVGATAYQYVWLSANGQPAFMGSITYPLGFSSYGSDNTCATVGVVDTGEGCELAVYFQPTQAGPAAGTVTVKDTSGNVIATVSVSGSGEGTDLYGDEQTLPFTGSSGSFTPFSLAVNGADNVYMTTLAGGGRVFELAAGSGTQQSYDITLPEGGAPRGLGVDARGDIFEGDQFSCSDNGGVVELATGSSSEQVLPCAGLGPVGEPGSIAVDDVGDVYAADFGDPGAVDSLIPGAGSWQQMATAGIDALSVAVNDLGNVYWAGFSGDTAYVWELPLGSTTPRQLPLSLYDPNFPEVYYPDYLAVDNAGDVFVGVLEIDNTVGPFVEGQKVLELPANGSAPLVLSVPGLCGLGGLAVDPSGRHLYVGIGSVDYEPNCSGRIVELSPVQATSITDLAPSSGTYGHPVTVTAKLTDTTVGAPVPGVSVTFTLNGAESCTTKTGAGGVASCALTPGEVAGDYRLTVSFAGAGIDSPTSTSAAFTVTRAADGVSYDGPATATEGKPVLVSARLVDSGGAALSGRTLTLALGSASCNGTTATTGWASCQLKPANIGAESAHASFAGDQYYLPSSASASVQVLKPATTPATPTTSTGPTPATTLTTSASVTSAATRATTLSASADPAVTGQHVTVTAAVSPLPGGGTIRFLDDGATIPGCAAVVLTDAGQARCHVVFAHAGRRRLEAVYSRVSGAADAPSPPLTMQVRWSLAVRRLRPGGGHAVRSRLRCAAHSGGCHARLTVAVQAGAQSHLLNAVARAGRRHQHARTVVVGTRHVFIRAGRSLTLTLALSGTGRQLLAGIARLHASLSVRLTVASRTSVVAVKRMLVPVVDRRSAFSCSKATRATLCWSAGAVAHHGARDRHRTHQGGGQ